MQANLLVRYCGVTRHFSDCFRRRICSLEGFSSVKRRDGRRATGGIVKCQAVSKTLAWSRGDQVGRPGIKAPSTTAGASVPSGYETAAIGSRLHSAEYLRAPN